MAGLAHRERRRQARGLIAGLAGMALLIGAPGASAVTSIGQLAPGPAPPPSLCTIDPYDFLQPSVASGASYVVPPNGAAITSWSTFASSAPNQALTFKVFRKVDVGDPFVWQVVGHDGPRPLTAGAVNTFPINIAVQPGDLVGMNLANPGGNSTACVFAKPGEAFRDRAGNLADGQTGTFSDVLTDQTMNLAAQVAIKPDSFFDFGKVTRNKSKGTARIVVNVPGPGTLSLTGAGVKPQRTARVTGSRVVTAAGKVRLLVKAKGAKRRKLSENGKVTVRVKVVYVPTGDVTGDPTTHARKVKLVRNV